MRWGQPKVTKDTLLRFIFHIVQERAFWGASLIQLFFWFAFSRGFYITSSQDIHSHFSAFPHQPPISLGIFRSPESPEPGSRLSVCLRWSFNQHSLLHESSLPCSEETCHITQIRSKGASTLSFSWIILQKWFSLSPRHPLPLTWHIRTCLITFICLSV